MTRLLVVVVNHRTAALVEEGLECLESQVARHPGRRVVVVDNDSKDGSFERLWPEVGSDADGGDGFSCPEDSIAEVDTSDLGEGAVDPDRPEL